MTSVALSLSVLLLSVVACSGSAALTPTPEPELTLEQLLATAGEKLAAVSTATFSMIDETESGARFFGQTLKTVEGQVKSPDGARLLVDVETPAFGFVEIEIVAVGEQAYIKFARDAPWVPLAAEDVPFNFGRIGVTLSELLPIMENATIVGEELVGDVATLRLDGDVTSKDMGDLITSVDAGHPVKLSFWLDEAEHTLQQFRIYGRIFDEDGPETSRLVTMEIGVPVDIQLPDVDAAP